MMGLQSGLEIRNPKFGSKISESSANFKRTVQFLVNFMNFSNALQNVGTCEVGRFAFRRLAGKQNQN